MASIDYGSLPAWVSAIGTTGALLINSFLLRKALIERSEALAEKRREQAAKVTAWMDGPKRAINVRNSSDAVVDQFFILLWCRKQGSEYGKLTDAELSVGELPPGETREMGIPWQEPIQWALTGIQFRDSAGRYWIRMVSTGLKEISPVKKWNKKGIVTTVVGGKLQTDKRKYIDPSLLEDA
ncbi:hypothetical protein ABZ671_24485 [Micromonospora sp. NPDC006766]|uniref:hypothetical protein n=1 Tax=Micromonospora sp. NPDC006766 TaxID=3154778 RepID=UPI0033EB0F01